MSIANRFNQFLDNHNLRVADVSKKTGIKDATLRNIIKRDSSISSDIIVQLADSYSELDVMWLIFGESKKNTSTNCQDCEDKLKLAELVIETQKELIQQLKKG